ncbi:WXG100 family type VII secretion target [Peterkaempfera griseoplana]|uniref:WXG100 family type VII secretion target n=1 Tax=Peterkaempfera griseoplana TaxID=66896 RepID=UPI0006E37A63|nr:hypothetical protein [Peterkaempfera griseoplana]
MSFVGKAWNDVTNVVEDVVMTPVEVAHAVLDKMFGGTEDLHRIAAELGTLGRRIDALRKEMDAAVGQVTWHGKAADAFSSHAQGRLRELAGAADDLEALGKSVERLANVM